MQEFIKKTSRAMKKLKEGHGRHWGSENRRPLSWGSQESLKLKSEG